MKKRFGMLLALVLVVLLGMTAVAMAEKCADGDCVYNIGDHGGNRCAVCNYTKDGELHVPQIAFSCGYTTLGDYPVGTHVQGYLMCSACGSGIVFPVDVVLDPNWHDGTVCKDCGQTYDPTTNTVTTHTWDAAKRECTVCGVIPEKCENHQYGKYYDPDTGKDVCSLCHNTGVVLHPQVHLLIGGQLPSVDEYKNENVHQVHLICNTFKIVENGQIVNGYNYHAICWDDPHKMIELDGHNVPVCFGYMHEGNVEWSYGCMADEYGNIHDKTGTCSVCCPDCDEGVLLQHGNIRVCNNCGKGTDGEVHSVESTSYTYKNASKHTVTETCTCGGTTVNDEDHTYNQTGHEAPYCVCGADASGKLHSGKSAECEACDKIREENACKHRVLINRYFTWVSATQHHESSECKECGEVFEGNSAHGTSATWHNGTVCVYCRTDENGVKHNWSNGKCTVCESVKPEPTPIPDGLNPDDGWYYVDGEKSSFTGLAEYDGGLFYIKDGQWQRGANGLTLIGEDFWFLAGGQVQEHHGFALYDGEWFYLDGGKLDVTASGVFEYNGKSFLVAAGRLVSECTGLAQVPSGEWYYVAEGRVLTEFSGEVEYDGKLFQIVNGKLVA